MSMIIKGLRYLKHYGLKEFFIRIQEKRQLNQSTVSYEQWYEKHCCLEAELQKQIKMLQGKELPKFGLIVLNESKEEKERVAFLHSLERQTYSNYELFQLEDIGKSLADYYVVLDTESVLCENYLYEMYCAFSEKGTTDLENDTNNQMIYVDSDIIDLQSETLYSPDLKPDYNLDLLRSYNYIGNVIAVSGSLCGVTEVVTALQMKDMYELVFACVENSDTVKHVAKVLFHACCMMPPKEMHAIRGLCSKVSVEAVEHHLARCGVSASVELIEKDRAETNLTDKRDIVGCRVFYERNEKSKVSIIIPNKDHIDVLQQCLVSIAKSTYSNYEVIIVENNSTESATFAFYDALQNGCNDIPMLSAIPSIQVVTWEAKGCFNYSAINNYGAQFANGEYLVLLNNDIEIISTDWLEEMVSVAKRRAMGKREQVGIVGAKLYYPDDTVQHAGVLVGIGGHARGIATNAFVGLERSDDGYNNRASVMCDYSAVTAACMMIRKSVFEEVGGLEEKLTVAFNDVDFCLRVREKGYLVVYDPFVEAYHYESKSRGQEDTKEKLKRFQSEIEYMRTTWIGILRDGDPYYNLGFSRVKNDYSL